MAGSGSIPRMKRYGVTLTSLFLVLFVLLQAAQTAAAAACAPPRLGCHQTDCDVGFCNEELDQSSPNQPSTPRPSSDSHPVQFSYTPACSGNRPDTGLDVLCVGATLSCGAPGVDRFWVFSRSWQADISEYGLWFRVNNPRSVCLGPDAVAQADPAAAAMAIVMAEWKSYRLPAATLVIAPQGVTLANVKTKFATTTPRISTLPPQKILGFEVVVTVTATDYLWDFGDGDTARASASSRPIQDHVYLRAGTILASLRTTYSATFQIAGRPESTTLPGLAEVPGVPISLTVATAQSQLEAG